MRARRQGNRGHQEGRDGSQSLKYFLFMLSQIKFAFTKLNFLKTAPGVAPYLWLKGSKEKPFLYPFKLEGASGGNE